MKDTYDSTIKKYGESVQPHSRLSVFGILDYRNFTDYDKYLGSTCPPAKRSSDSHSLP
ncbi:hypothetical protein BGX34_006301, partial [Mortierella sp. NVP85]